MIVFGTAVTDAETYDRCATPGIRRAAEPDSVVLAHHTAGSVFRNYNMLLDKAAAYDDLEALVLLHQDVELVDANFAATVREALEDPDVADHRLCRRHRSPQPRLVAGRPQLGGPHPPLPGVRGRGLPGHLVEARGRALVREHRRSRLGRRLRHGPLRLGRAEPPLRRVAGKAPRLRLRHLHAGPRGGQEGGDRPVPGHPPPLTEADQRARDLDPDPHQAGGEVGRPAPRHRCGAGRAGPPGRGGGRLRQGDHGRPADEGLRGQPPGRAPRARAADHEGRAQGRPRTARSRLAQGALERGGGRSSSRRYPDVAAFHGQGAGDRLRGGGARDPVVREPRTRHRVRPVRLLHDGQGERGARWCWSTSAPGAPEISC